MFRRTRKTSCTGPLLVGCVVARPDVAASGPTSAEALVRQLREFLDGAEEAAKATGGNVVQFAGNASCVAWPCGPGAAGGDVDALGRGRRVLEVIRRRGASMSGVTLCVALAFGDCVYEEQAGRVLRVMGHAWLRVVRQFQPDLGGDADAIVLDRSLMRPPACDTWTDVGDGWYRAPQATA